MVNMYGRTKKEHEHAWDTWNHMESSSLEITVPHLHHRKVPYVNVKFYFPRSSMFADKIEVENSQIENQEQNLWANEAAS